MSRLLTVITTLLSTPLLLTAPQAKALSLSVWGSPSQANCHTCMEQCPNGQHNSPPLDCDRGCPEVCQGGDNNPQLCDDAKAAAQSACSSAASTQANFNPPAGGSCADAQQAAQTATQSLQTAVSGCTSAASQCQTTCSELGVMDACQGLTSQVTSLQNQANSINQQALQTPACQQQYRGNSLVNNGMNPQSAQQPFMPMMPTQQQQQQPMQMNSLSGGTTPNSLPPQVPADTKTADDGSSKPSFQSNVNDAGAFPSLDGSSTGAKQGFTDASQTQTPGSDQGRGARPFRGGMMMGAGGGMGSPQQQAANLPPENRAAYYQKSVSTNVLNGVRGGGGGYSYTSNDSRALASARDADKMRFPAGGGLIAGDDMAHWRGIDLKHYLPGMNGDPRRLSGSSSGRTDIHQADDVLWQPISKVFRVHCYLKDLYGCQ